ncbi:MAG: integration host factor subunit alpha [Desulfobulbaceae bacterium]|nr:integration host factor subunit alpha [Desulfobulbaceae bacterium]MCK5322881.1 integration host factor subunit alpha [Desulfobulbaceae bacterium]MCK5544010.1 integration host factor subunit alpha [Desulfobulbaceae bacterium]
MAKSNLTRKDLARVLHEKLGFSYRGSSDIVDSTFLTMRQALLEEESIKLVQFGTFTVRKKSARRGRNPRTGETMEISKRSMVTFKPSKKLREKVNDNLK